MKNSNFLIRDLKTFAVVNFSTGIIMLLSSIIGHYLTTHKLIPSSVIGGAIGLLSGVYFCFKLNYIDKRVLFPVSFLSLFYFGAISLVAVFNLHNPVVILVGFSLAGLITIIGNRYFSSHHRLSTSRIYGTLGLMFAFPAFYFVVASILKFQFGQNVLFGFVEKLLTRTNGQENFNAITPFLFGGGLLLAFFLNVFSQIENIGATINFNYKNLRLRIKTLNLTVVILSGLIGLTILSYLAAENL